MEHIPSESQPGYYDAYTHPNGKKYIVLEGLHPEDIHTPGALEQFMHQHHNTFATGYWILFTVTMVYLVAMYILIPLAHKWDLRVWSLTNKRKKN